MLGFGSPKDKWNNSRISHKGRQGHIDFIQNHDGEYSDLKMTPRRLAEINSVIARQRVIPPPINNNALSSTKATNAYNNAKTARRNLNYYSDLLTKHAKKLRKKKTIKKSDDAKMRRLQKKVDKYQDQFDFYSRQYERLAGQPFSR